MTNEFEPRVARARRQSVRARERLTGTLVEIQNRLRPGALLEDAMEDLRLKADEMAQEAVDLVRNKPATVAGVVLAVIAYLFRGQLLDALGVLLKRGDETEDESHEFEQESGVGDVPRDMEERT